MAKVQYGIPQGLTAQGLSHEQIAQLMLQMQLQRGQDPSQTPGYDSLGDYGQQPNHPVYSVGQGLADVAGQLGSAYFRKKRDQQLMQGMAANAANYKVANDFASNPDASFGDAQKLNRGFLPAQPAFPGGQAPPIPGAGGPPSGPMPQAQGAFDNPTNNRVLSPQERGAAAIQSLNGPMAMQYGDQIRKAAMESQPPPPVMQKFTPGERGVLTNATTGQPLPNQPSGLDGGPPLTDLGKTLLAQGIKPGSKEWNAAMAADADKATGNDPLSKAHLAEAQASADLTKSRLEQLKQGQLDDDAIEFRGHLAAAGDPSAYQGIPKSIYGSVSIAKIGNRAAALAKEQAEAEGLPPEEAARRQAQVNIAFKGAQKAYGSVATTGAQKDQVAIEMGKLGNQLEDASKGVARKGWVDLNALTNYAASHTDDPEYGKLDVAVQGFKTAYSAALVRGGQATDSARAHADALFSGARNHEDLMARVKQAQKEIGAVLESTSETKANVLAGVGGGTSTPTRAAPPLPGAPGPKVQKWGRDAQGNPVQLP